jgi:hypothetical protein
MSLANPLVITVNSVAKNLNRINQDGYGSEYLLREATQEFRAKVRHSKEGVQADGTQFDRHNVELTQTVYATDTTPKITRVVYTVLRCTYDDDGTEVGYLGVGLSDLLVASTFDDLVAWIS